MISKWGTPKTPAPSGPLTLYVGPSRDAGRLRARQDRHRAAAPLFRMGRTFQTDSLSRPGPRAAGARGGSRFRGLRWTALLESGRPSSAVCKMIIVSRWSVDDHHAMATHGLPTRSASPTSLTCPSDPADSRSRPASSLAEFFSLARPPSGPLSPSSRPGCCRQAPPAKLLPLGHLICCFGAPAMHSSINRAVV